MEKQKINVYCPFCGQEFEMVQIENSKFKLYHFSETVACPLNNKKSFLGTMEFDSIEDAVEKLKKMLFRTDYSNLMSKIHIKKSLNNRIEEIKDKYRELQSTNFFNDLNDKVDKCIPDLKTKYKNTFSYDNSNEPYATFSFIDNILDKTYTGYYELFNSANQEIIQMEFELYGYNSWNDEYESVYDLYPIPQSFIDNSQSLEDLFEIEKRKLVNEIENYIEQVNKEVEFAAIQAKIKKEESIQVKEDKEYELFLKLKEKYEKK